MSELIASTAPTNDEWFMGALLIALALFFIFAALRMFR
jgi:hypothetical protein